jgi:hypothetical protein
LDSSQRSHTKMVVGLWLGSRFGSWVMVVSNKTGKKSIDLRCFLTDYCLLNTDNYLSAD